MQMWIFLEKRRYCVGTCMYTVGYMCRMYQNGGCKRQFPPLVRGDYVCLCMTLYYSMDMSLSSQANKASTSSSCGISLAVVVCVCDVLFVVLGCVSC